MISKVFCVDDDPVTLMICNIMLEKVNFCKQIDEAGGGLAALKYFENQLVKQNPELPELILLDINMPVMNGWEFLDEYIEKYLPFIPDCKIIILTSSVNPEDKELAENHPYVTGFMPKPLTLEGLEKLKELPSLSKYFAGTFG
jgi:CheY-like chemotaxis protein